MKREKCTTCQDAGTVLADGPAWCDQYNVVHSEPVLEPCPTCQDEHVVEETAPPQETEERLVSTLKKIQAWLASPRFPEGRFGVEASVEAAIARAIDRADGEK